jgi:hypothetical protein
MELFVIPRDTCAAHERDFLEPYQNRTVCRDTYSLETHVKFLRFLYVCGAAFWHAKDRDPGACMLARMMHVLLE